MRGLHNRVGTRLTLSLPGREPAGQPPVGLSNHHPARHRSDTVRRVCSLREIRSPLVTMNASRKAPIQTSSQSSKRHHQSLNHLLNFTLPPRVQHVTPLPRRTKRPIKHQAQNKESELRFLSYPESDTISEHNNSSLTG